FTLNQRQKLAFLLLVNDRMQRLQNPQQEPFHFIVGGPGESGKSHLYDALCAFYMEIGCSMELTFTAPTGVAASNIHGSTIHSEASYV
ncbi:hypothetical protein BDP27DRAFT_1230140, partial [Rhodocollybia butyracea]